MSHRVGMEVSIAVAEAVKLAEVDIVAAYPITPQTHIVEHLAELVADGELDAEFVPVESEHSALSVCIGTSAVGARTFTSTSSQGLALMHEILYITSAMRMPIVMVCVNRALSGPLNIWNDHSDVMGERDTGWLMTFAENGQEALDLTLHAFRVAEDPRVSLPIMVNFDGFIVSHVIEPVFMPDLEEVRAFLPPFQPAQRLDVDRPVSMGIVGIPDIYTESKKAQEEAVRGAYGPIVEAWADFERIFGRRYRPVENYRAEDAEVILLMMGGIAETAMTYVDEARSAGKKVGLVRLRLFRPFPKQDLLAALGPAKCVVILDRCLSVGGPGGPVASEVKGALYGGAHQPKVVEFVVGLGGRDVQLADFERMHAAGAAVAAGAPVPPFDLLQVRA